MLLLGVWNFAEMGQGLGFVAPLGIVPVLTTQDQSQWQVIMWSIHLWDLLYSYQENFGFMLSQI